MYTVKEFADFCRARGDAKYQYTDNKRCALGQFLKDKGWKEHDVTSSICWFNEKRYEINYNVETAVLWPEKDANGLRKFSDIKLHPNYENEELFIEDPLTRSKQILMKLV